MTQPHPFRFAESRAPAQDWERLCGWAENSDATRFSAVIDSAIRVVFVVLVVSTGVGLLVPLLAATAFAFARDTYVTVTIGAVTFVLALVSLMWRMWPMSRVQVEVTPATTTITSRERARVPTSAILRVEVDEGGIVNAESASSWSVKLVCGEQIVPIPAWSSSKSQAKMRAERLQNVIMAFQSAAGAIDVPKTQEQ
jgi:hypothetical protein